jgi:hypothetical protein
MTEPTRKDREAARAAIFGAPAGITTMNSIKDGIVDRVAQAIATARAEGYAQAIADQSQSAQRAEGMRGTVR